MTHTFVENLTNTPASPNNPVPEAAMPQRASRTLLWDAFQGLRPTYTPQTLH